MSIEFEEFWKIYPRKVGRHAAALRWNRMTDRQREFALRSLGLWVQTVQWNSSDGLYVPYGSTFLNQERYLDEPWTRAFEEAGLDPKKITP